MKYNLYLNLSFSCVLILCMINMASCQKVFGTGEIITENRTVSEFTGIQIANSANVEVVKGTSLMVEVSDYENLLKNLSVKTVNNLLVIKTEPSNLYIERSKTKVRITAPESLLLKNLLISGSGNIKLNGIFSNIASVEISGSGNITSEEPATFTDIAVNISGSGNVLLKGKAENVSALISGSGNIKLRDLETKNATCNISGSGNILINAIEKLVAKIGGSGNIEYFGNPTIDKNISGSGKVVKR